MVVVACGKRLCSLPLPSTSTLNQVVITTTTTKILPCLPCVLPKPTACTPCTKVDRFNQDTGKCKFGAKCKFIHDQNNGSKT